MLILLETSTVASNHIYYKTQNYAKVHLKVRGEWRAVGMNYLQRLERSVRVNRVSYIPQLQRAEGKLA